MEYVGLHTQQARNNFRSIILLCLFPCLLAMMVLLFSMFLVFFSGNYWPNLVYGWNMSMLVSKCLTPLALVGVVIWFVVHPQQIKDNFLWFPCLVILVTFLFSLLLGFVIALLMFFILDGNWYQLLPTFRQLAPHMLAAMVVWFVVAYFIQTSIIRKAVGARPLERRENKRVYNMVENLSMLQGMAMPKIDLIEDDSLNAFASGIDDHTYTISLSRGLINTLTDEELEGVIAHELAHIRNRDTRLLIISIVFVGIFAIMRRFAFSLLGSGSRRGRGGGRSRGGGDLRVTLILLLVATIGYFFSALIRFAISRSREYMADASSAEMTHKPQALASALRKISQNPHIKAAEHSDVAMFFDVTPLFIEYSEELFGDSSDDEGEQIFELFEKVSSLFATHPPIKKRIALLEQF